MWQLDYKKGCAQKNPCFWIAVLEEIFESPLDYKEIKSVIPKGNQLWIFIGRTDAETLIFWPPDVKSWVIGKDPDDGKMEGKRRRQQKMRWLDSFSDSVDMNLSKLQETVKNRGAWLSTVQGLPKSWTWLNDWTTTKFMINQVKREMANWKWNLQHLQQDVSISNNAHIVFLKYKELQTDGKI